LVILLEMRVKELTKSEIEERFANMGDYVGMDYLSSCLKNHLDFDTRKFVLIKLCGLYESRKMFSNAGKLMRSAAEINTTYQNKITDFLKSADLFIKAGNYDEADVSIKKSFGVADEKQKNDITRSVKEFYKTQARLLIQKGRRNSSMFVYERLLKLDLDEKEKYEIKEKLLEIYGSLGKSREYEKIKKLK
jgi:tetratricopeptide (TPR) repeat protein